MTPKQIVQADIPRNLADCVEMLRTFRILDLPNDAKLDGCILFLSHLQGRIEMIRRLCKGLLI